MGNSDKKPEIKKLDYKIMDYESFETDYFQFYFNNEQIRMKEFTRIIIKDRKEETFDYKEIKIKLCKPDPVCNDIIFYPLRYHEIKIGSDKFSISFKTDQSYEILIFAFENDLLSLIHSQYRTIWLRKLPLFVNKDMSIDLGLRYKRYTLFCKLTERDGSFMILHHRDLSYKISNGELFCTEKSENKNTLQNTFIGFEDIIRLSNINNGKIPFFWTQNYLPSYKKLKENSGELFERNVFKTIIDYI
jgi:hypothetical protein